MPDITVYFGTNRMPISDATGAIVDFGSEPGPIDGAAVRFGSAEVRVSAKSARIVPGSLDVAPEKLTPPNQHRGSRDIFDKLRQDMADGGRPTLVHIHGFSNSFTDALERAATTLHFYGIDANVFSFTWPSRNSGGPIPLPYVDYVHDRDTARESGLAMARTLRILYDYINGLPARDRCRQPLHLICHSMGVYALRHALQALMRLPVGEPRELAPVGGAPGPAPGSGAPAGEPFPALIGLPTEDRDPNRLRRTFDQIILAAADEDEDSFDDELELKYLPRLAAGVTVYHTPEDWVLGTLSRFTKFNGPRLGNDGPENMATISDKVVAVDVTDVIDPTQDFQSHQYYRIFPKVRDDIVAVLSGVRPDEFPNRDPVGAMRRYRIRKGRRRGGS
ncbi:MAG: alpha/beta fold hydrolase [Rhodospirillales bacterium]|nr:alpha/beta fold hydrolase [Rhodospirillales bacterium]